MLSTSEMITKAGFKVEEHTVTTDDGYVLTLFRLYDGESTINGISKPAVFMQHGLVASSDDWVMSTPDRAPAFIVAKAGYDVWLGNSRGTYYSRQHTILDPDRDVSYWQFSFTDIGVHDLPACLSYVHSIVGRKISLIAHSMGTSETMYAMTKMPDFFRKHINLFYAWAPVAKIDHMEPAY
jgi:pimeloyl-ACP methyl ester carboxylesterase